jgi:hypothetical protein
MLEAVWVEVYGIDSVQHGFTIMDDDTLSGIVNYFSILEMKMYVTMWCDTDLKLVLSYYVQGSELQSVN